MVLEMVLSSKYKLKIQWMTNSYNHAVEGEASWAQFSQFKQSGFFICDLALSPWLLWVCCACLLIFYCTCIVTRQPSGLRLVYQIRKPWWETLAQWNLLWSTPTEAEHCNVKVCYIRLSVYLLVSNIMTVNYQMMMIKDKREADLIGRKAERSLELGGEVAATTMECGSALVLNGLCEGKWWLWGIELLLVSHNRLVVCCCGLSFACMWSNEVWSWRHLILVLVDQFGKLFFFRKIVLVLCGHQVCLG